MIYQVMRASPMLNGKLTLNVNPLMSPTRNEIFIPRKIIQNILQHAQQDPNIEVCGLISQLNKQPYCSYPIDNNAEHPESFFNMDAQQQIQAMTAMRNNNEQLFAIYHSHPSAPAIPSTTDLAQVTYPKALYLIISLNTKGILEIRAYQIQNQQFQEVFLHLS